MRRSFVFATTLALATSLAFAQHPSPQGYVGFDLNEYPGDALLPELHQRFAFVGYWLTNPPGTHSNGWPGKRSLLRSQGFGFLVLANGRLDQQIKASRTPAAALGQQDGIAAAAAARREGFPAQAVLFLDQEEGGRLLPEQMAYLLGWTEMVAASSFRPGVYASGQPVPDGPGKTITTAQDIREHIAAQHLHPIALWVYQDACPPAPGCTLQPPALAASGTPDAIAWQYAQSPRRKDRTAACARTYAADGNCYAGDPNHLPLDLSVAGSPDPSGGR